MSDVRVGGWVVVQVYRSWAELWAGEESGHMIRASMHTHMFVLPMGLLGAGSDAAARCVLLRMCSLAMSLRDLVQTAAEAVALPSGYRCALNPRLLSLACLEQLL